MIPLFYGFDNRESIGAHVFQHSVLTRSSEPVSFIPLHLNNMKSFYQEHHKDGTNAFIYSRFLIPYLMGYKGWAIFMDGADMLCLDDIAKLWDMRDPINKAVMVVKHDYKTTSNKKYIGTGMEANNGDYPRKNWSSVMLINCNHFAWREVTPEYVKNAKGSDLHQFKFIKDEAIGELPKEWNHIVIENAPNPDAKLVHYSLGIPGFKYYENCEYSDEWFHEREMMQWSVPSIKEAA